MSRHDEQASHFGLEWKGAHTNFDVENWYHKIQKRTFYTQLEPLTSETARAIVGFYQRRYNGRDDCFRAADHQSLIAFEQLLDSILSQDEFRGHGAFVRLSSRSPKDGQPRDPTRFEAVMEDAFAQLREQDLPCDVLSHMSSDEHHCNNRLAAFSVAQMRCSRVVSGSEALCIILSSERVFVDLSQELRCLEEAAKWKAARTQEEDVPYQWNVHLVVRRWEKRLDDSMEFRCFVHNNHLTAISQYNHYCVFPEVLKHKDEIKRKITAYWPTVHNEVDLPSYVIDVGILKLESRPAIDNTCLRHDNQSETILVSAIWTNHTNKFTVIATGSDQELCQDDGICVIELNPFLNSTGASLFDWRADDAILHCDGNAPAGTVHFRVRNRPYQHIVEHAAMIDHLTQETQTSKHDLLPYDEILAQWFPQQRWCSIL